MIPIKDLETYIHGMEKSMLDKLWWLDMIPKDITNVYDFGCADGALLSAVSLVRPKYTLQGYDINQAMIEAAQKRLPQAKFSTLPVIYLKENSVLVASSVIHEIYSYSSKPKRDMENIFNCGAEYIAIRDMFFNNPGFGNRYEDVMKIIAYEPKEKVREFESIWGQIYDPKNMVHYLLKYRYLNNWEREVRENYFPIDLDEFREQVIPSNKYKVVYVKRYTLPFVKQRTLEDFGIDLKYDTHAKLLLKRVD